MKPESTKLTLCDQLKHWREVRKITHDPTLSPLEKLNRCVEYGDRVCIETQDDFLVHPTIKAQRQKMIAELPAIMKRAEQKAKDKATGQTEIEL